MAWPTAVATDGELHVAVNKAFNSLASSITAGDTTIPLVSAALFPTAGFVTIGAELIKYTGKAVNSLTGATRGFDGTTAAAASAGAGVYHFIVSQHHNALKDELIALENNLSSRIGVGISAIRAIDGSVSSTAYQFASSGASSGLFYNNGVSVAKSGSIICRFDNVFLVFVDVQVSGQIQASIGSVGAPSLSCSSDTNTGFYFVGADVMVASTGGTASVTFGANATVNKGQLLVQDGTQSAPALSFASEGDLGIYRSAAGELSLAEGSTPLASFKRTKTALMFNGSNEVLIDDTTVGHRALFLGRSGESKVFLRGGFGLYPEEPASSFTTGVSTGAKLDVNASSAPVTVTIGANDQLYFITKKDDSANAVIVAGSYADSFAPGLSSVTLKNQGDYVALVATSGRYQVLGFRLSGITTVTTTGTLSTPMTELVLANATSGAMTLTLPPAARCANRRLTIKKTDASANVVTLDGDGAETIDGALTLAISTQYQSYTLISDGSNWHIV